MPASYSICFVTAGTEKAASLMARGLVKERLAACVNVMGNVSSFYRWQGKVEKSPERLLIIKTRKNLLKNVERFIKREHAYTVPEILFLDIAGGSEEYLSWLGANTLFTADIPKNKSGKNMP